MNETTKTEAAEIAAILQSYINVCGITQYVEPIARNFDVIEKIKCKLRICNMSDFVRQAVAALDAKLSTINSKEKAADAGTSNGKND